MFAATRCGAGMTRPSTTCSRDSPRLGGVRDGAGDRHPARPRRSSSSPRRSKNPNFLFSRDGFRDLLLTPSILLLVAVGQAIVIITRNVDLSVGSIARPDRLPDRAPVHRPARHPAGRRSSSIGIVVRRPARPHQRRARRVREGAGARDHARHALRLPRHQRAVDRQRPHQRLRHAQGLPRARHRPLLGIPFLTIIARRRAGRRRLVPAQPARRPRALRDRLRPRGRAPLRPQGHPARARRVRRSSGALAGLAGVLYAARYGTVSSQAGSGWELDAVGAAVIGGVAISGGIGTVWGAAIGAFLLLTINRALPILGIHDFWQRAVVGVLIIGAIVLDRVLVLRQNRRLMRRRGNDG